MSNIVVKYYYGGETHETSSNIVDDEQIYFIADIAYSYESFKVLVSVSDSNNSAIRLNKQWDFGDGTIIYAETAEHAYKKPGKYKITCQTYEIGNGSPDKVYAVYIIVKEAFASNIEFCSKTEPFYISKNNKIGHLFTNVSNYFINKPRILAYLVNADIFKDKENIIPSYWNYHDKSYYHLNKYFCFLEEDNGESTNEKLIYSLKPVEYYTPKYYNVYGYHYKENDSLKLKLYILLNYDDSEDNIEEYKKYLFCVKDINGNDLEILPKENIEIEAVYSSYALNQNAAYLGMVSKTDIWFKNDIYIEGEKNILAFEFYENDMFAVGENDVEDSYLNLKTTFHEISLKKLDKNANSDLYVKGLTLNGLLTKEHSKNEEISTPYIIDSHVIKNLYKNKPIDIYQAYYIKNDPLKNRTMNDSDEIITYSLYKGFDKTESGGKELDELSFYYSDIEKELGEESGMADNSEKSYYRKYSSDNVPKKYITIKEGDTQIYKNNHELIDLDELVIPTEHKLNIDVERLLNAYMGHPMYDNTINLKNVLYDILANKDALEYVMRKSEHFVDDTINYKTCHISSLIDILTMFNEEVTDHNINSFNNLNDFKELLRILTMSYSDLFGRLILSYDIKISQTYKGKNVSDLLDYNDEIVCDENYSIIAIIKNNTIYRLKEKTPYIICQDNKSNATSLLSFYKIESYNTSKKIEELQKLFVETTTFNIYKLKEYNKSWGWNLILPKETENYNTNLETLEQFYNFYLFNPTYKVERKNNFIDNSTIPYDKNGNAVDIKEWDNVGFDCLMKLLYENVQ